MSIQAESMVEITYEIVDGEGTVVESSADDGPISYLHGEGQILPGLETALEGKDPGASFEVTLSPEQAFGDYDVEGVINVPRSEFPPDAELVPGDFITVSVEDADPDDEGYEMRVVEISPESVILDGNHPLAGKEVTFRVQVVSVRPATPEELSRARELQGG